MELSSTASNIINGLENIRPGQKVQYYSGFLVKDREAGTDQFNTQELDIIASAAQNLWKDGRAFLVQCRIGQAESGEFGYLAIGR